MRAVYCDGRLMYFDLFDYRPDTPRMPTAMSIREAVLVSLVIGTAYGALVGSVVVGMLVQLSTLWVAPELKNVVALLVLIVILVVRPQGILGQAERVG